MLLNVANLSGGYGRLPIIHDVSLHLDEGEIVTLIGPNGSGKSTLLKLICSLADTHSGTTMFAGKNITNVDTEEIIRSGMGYVPQRENVFPTLLVSENLEMGTHALRDWRAGMKELDHVYSLFPVLYERRNQVAGTLSGGERQMLAIARALLGKPKLVLMDEPSAALSPRLAEEVFDRLQEIRDAGIAILLAEQNASEALEFSDRAHVLISGQLEFSGSGREILESEEVIERVLGGQSAVSPEM